MKKFLAALAIAMMATAAMADGGHGNGGPGGMGPGGRGPEDAAGPGGGDVIIATDGTAYVTRDTTAAGSATRTESLSAISATGATLWTVSLSGNHGPLFLSGANLVSVSSTRPTDTTTASSTISALSTASGAVVWTLNVDGIVTSARPVNGGVYAIVVTPATTTGGTATRKLVSISSSGAILWSVAL